MTNYVCMSRFKRQISTAVKYMSCQKPLSQMILIDVNANTHIKDAVV